MWDQYLKKIKNIKFSESYISMGLGLAVVLVIGVLLYNFFSNRTKPGNSSPQAAKTEQQKEEQTGFPKSYTVVLGDNLWTIAEKNYNSGYKWMDLAKANKLANPDYLWEGQVLTLPDLSATPSINGSGAQTEAITGNSYTVTEGDNLWEISVRAYSDGYQWTKIAQANQLANPDLIYAGNVLSLPR